MVSEAKRAAINKWNKENLKQINLSLKLSEYNELKEHCAKLGKPVNGYIRELINSDLHGGNMSLTSLIPGELLNDFIQVITAENADLSMILTSAVSRYIDRRKQKQGD